MNAQKISYVINQVVYEEKTSPDFVYIVKHGKFVVS